MISADPPDRDHAPHVGVALLRLRVDTNVVVANLLDEVDSRVAERLPGVALDLGAETVDAPVGDEELEAGAVAAPAEAVVAVDLEDGTAERNNLVDHDKRVERLRQLRRLRANRAADLHVEADERVVVRVQSAGVRPTSLSSVWEPFVVHPVRAMLNLRGRYGKSREPVMSYDICFAIGAESLISF